MDPKGLRLAPLREWMGSVGIDVAMDAPLTADLLAGGRSNVSYLLTDAAQRTWVLRRPPLGHVLPTAHDMGREFTVLSGLNRVHFPTPRAIALCEDEEVIGARFLLMDYIEGRVIADSDGAAALSPDEASDICASLVDTLADLHAISPQDAGLAALGRPDGYLERQLSRWSQQWELTATRELPVVTELAAQLQERAAGIASAPGGIVHGDYRLDNTILDPASPRVKAVVDWEMSTLGDPAMDLAIMLVYWTDPGDGLRADVPVAQHITDRPGFWNRGQIVARYVERTGLDLAQLEFCTGLACFKLAVIMESILARSLKGQQMGSGASETAAMGQATQALAQMGVAVLDRGVEEGLSS